MANGFEVDLKKCVGCKACQAVCKMRYELPIGVNRRRVLTKDTTDSRLFISMACNHCAEPACVAACPKGAIAKDSEGRVIADKAKCVGCRRCEWACPYGAIAYDSSGKVEKCDACATKADGPRCVEACHARALAWIDDAAFVDGDKQIVADSENLLSIPALTQPRIKFVKP